jgi:hypothetical protein
MTPRKPTSFKEIKASATALRASVIMAHAQRPVTTSNASTATDSAAGRTHNPFGLAPSNPLGPPPAIVDTAAPVSNRKVAILVLRMGA